MSIGIVTYGLESVEFNGPLMPPIWDGEPGLRTGQIAYDEDGSVSPADGPGPIWWDGSEWKRSATAGTAPDLQQVTDVGAITTNSIQVDKTGVSDVVGVSQIAASANSSEALAALQAFSVDDGVGGLLHLAQLLLQATTCSIVLSTNRDLNIINDSDQVLLTILANGSGIRDRNNVVRVSGTGDPNGVITGAPGSTFSRTNGSAGETFYVKQSGTGNTGWSPIA